MKCLNNVEQIAQNLSQEKLDNKVLRKIKNLLSNKYLEKAKQRLSALESDNLSEKNLLFYYFLQARYYVKLYRQDNDVEHLEWANDYMDDVFHKAYKYNIKIRDNRYYYTRAYVKFQLSKLVWDEDRKPWLLSKAKSITEKALRFYPNNPSFNWLQTQFIV